jgi:hypothetical protein
MRYPRSCSPTTAAERLAYVVGLTAGLVAQIAWGTNGMDEMAASKAHEQLR